MEFQRDVEAVPVPSPSLTETLGGVLEQLAVGESGCVVASLGTVRTLLARHVGRQRERVISAVSAGEGGRLREQSVTYTKRFIARATTEPGVVRVWRVQ